MLRPPDSELSKYLYSFRQINIAIEGESEAISLDPNMVSNCVMLQAYDNMIIPYISMR